MVGLERFEPTLNVEISEKIPQNPFFERVRKFQHFRTQQIYLDMIVSYLLQLFRIFRNSSARVQAGGAEFEWLETALA